MVFLATKAALAATIVGVGVTFGALSYLARRGQENGTNNGLQTTGTNLDASGSNRGFPAFSLFSTLSSDPSPSSQASRPLFALPTRGFRLFGASSPSTSSSRDCNCKVIHECSTFFGGASHSFRLRRTCGFQGFVRKICCDDQPLFFSTPPPQFALDEVKSAHATLNTNTINCQHNHSANGSIRGCNCDHYQSSDDSSKTEGSLRSEVDSATGDDDSGGGTNTIALFPLMSFSDAPQQEVKENKEASTTETTTSTAKTRLRFPELEEYFKDDKPDEDTSSAVPLETLLPALDESESSKGRNDRIDAFFGEDMEKVTEKSTLTVDGTGVGSSISFPSLDKYFPEEGASIDFSKTLTTTTSTIDASSTMGSKAPGGDVELTTPLPSSTTTSATEASSTMESKAPGGDVEEQTTQLPSTTSMTSVAESSSHASPVTTSSTSTTTTEQEQLVTKVPSSTETPDVSETKPASSTSVSSLTGQDDNMRSVPIPQVPDFDDMDILEVPETTTVKKVLTSQPPIIEEFPDVTESIVHGSRSGTSRPQSLEFEHSVEEEGSRSAIPDVSAIQESEKVTTAPTFSPETTMSPIGGETSGSGMGKGRQFPMSSISIDQSYMNERVSSTINKTLESVEGEQSDSVTSTTDTTDLPEQEVSGLKESHNSNSDTSQFLSTHSPKNMEDDSFETSTLSHPTSMAESDSIDLNEESTATTVRSGFSEKQSEHHDVAHITENVTESETSTSSGDISESTEASMSQISVKSLTSPDNEEKSTPTSDIPMQTEAEAMLDDHDMGEVHSLASLAPNDESSPTMATMEPDVSSMSTDGKISVDSVEYTSTSESVSLNLHKSAESTTSSDLQMNNKEIHLHSVDRINIQEINDEQTTLVPSLGPVNEEHDEAVTSSSLLTNDQNHTTTDSSVEHSVSTTIQSFISEIISLINTVTTTISPVGDLLQNTHTTTIPSKDSEETTISPRNDENGIAETSLAPPVTSFEQSTTNGQEDELEGTSSAPTTLSEEEAHFTTAPSGIQTKTTESPLQIGTDYSSIPDEDYSLNELPAGRKVPPSLGQLGKNLVNDLDDNNQLKSTTSLRNESVTEASEVNVQNVDSKLEMLSTSTPQNDEITAGTLKIIELPATTPMPKTIVATLEVIPNEDESEKAETTTLRFEDDKESAYNDGGESTTVNVPGTSSTLHASKDDYETTTKSSDNSISSDEFSFTTTQVPKVNLNDNNDAATVLTDNGIISTTTITLADRINESTEASPSTHVEDVTHAEMKVSDEFEDEVTSTSTTPETPTPTTTNMEVMIKDDNESVNRINIMSPIVMQIQEDAKTPASLLRGEEPTTQLPDSSTVPPTSGMLDVETFSTTTEESTTADLQIRGDLINSVKIETTTMKGLNIPDETTTRMYDGSTTMIMESPTTTETSNPPVETSTMKMHDNSVPVNITNDDVTLTEDSSIAHEATTNLSTYDDSMISINAEPTTTTSESSNIPEQTTTNSPMRDDSMSSINLELTPTTSESSNISEETTTNLSTHDDSMSSINTEPPTTTSKSSNVPEETTSFMEQHDDLVKTRIADATSTEASKILDTTTTNLDMYDDSTNSTTAEVTNTTESADIPVETTNFSQTKDEILSSSTSDIIATEGTPDETTVNLQMLDGLGKPMNIEARTTETSIDSDETTGASSMDNNSLNSMSRKTVKTTTEATSMPEEATTSQMEAFSLPQEVDMSTTTDVALDSRKGQHDKGSETLLISTAEGSREETIDYILMDEEPIESATSADRTLSSSIDKTTELVTSDQDMTTFSSKPITDYSSIPDEDYSLNELPAGRKVPPSLGQLGKNSVNDLDDNNKSKTSFRNESVSETSEVNEQNVDRKLETTELVTSDQDMTTFSSKPTEKSHTSTETILIDEELMDAGSTISPVPEITEKSMFNDDFLVSDASTEAEKLRDAIDTILTGFNENVSTTDALPRMSKAEASTTLVPDLDSPVEANTENERGMNDGLDSRNESAEMSTFDVLEASTFTPPDTHDLTKYNTSFPTSSPILLDSTTSGTEPELQSSTETSSTEPELQSSTETSSTKPELQLSTETSGIESELQSSTKTSGTEPELQSLTETSSTEPELQSSTETLSTKPELQSSKETSGIEPELQSSTETSSTEPELQSSTETSNTEPELQSSTKTSNTVPELQSSTETSSSFSPMVADEVAAFAESEQTTTEGISIRKLTVTESTILMDDMEDIGMSSNDYTDVETGSLETTTLISEDNVATSTPPSSMSFEDNASVLDQTTTPTDADSKISPPSENSTTVLSAESSETTTQVIKKLISEKALPTTTSPTSSESTSRLAGMEEVPTENPLPGSRIDILGEEATEKVEATVVSQQILSEEDGDSTTSIYKTTTIKPEEGVTEEIPLADRGQITETSTTSPTAKKDSSESVTTEDIEILENMEATTIPELTELGMMTTEAPNETHASYAATTEYADPLNVITTGTPVDESVTASMNGMEEMTSTPGATAVPMMNDELVMGEDGLPITEITKSVRREPDTDKTVVKLTHMSSKQKNKVTKTVTAIKSGSEATVSELTTESPAGLSTTTTGQMEQTTTEIPLTSYAEEESTVIMDSLEDGTTMETVTSASLVIDRDGELNLTETLQGRAAGRGVPLPIEHKPDMVYKSDPTIASVIESSPKTVVNISATETEYMNKTLEMNDEDIELHELTNVTTRAPEIFETTSFPTTTVLPLDIQSTTYSDESLLGNDDNERMDTLVMTTTSFPENDQTFEIDTSTISSETLVEKHDHTTEIIETSTVSPEIATERFLESDMVEETENTTKLALVEGMDSEFTGNYFLRDAFDASTTAVPSGDSTIHSESMMEFEYDSLGQNETYATTTMPANEVEGLSSLLEQQTVSSSQTDKPEVNNEDEWMTTSSSRATRLEVDPDYVSEQDGNIGTTIASAVVTKALNKTLNLEITTTSPTIGSTGSPEFNDEDYVTTTGPPSTTSQSFPIENVQNTTEPIMYSSTSNDSTTMPTTLASTDRTPANTESSSQMMNDDEGIVVYGEAFRDATTELPIMTTDATNTEEVPTTESNGAFETTVSTAALHEIYNTLFGTSGITTTWNGSSANNDTLEEIDTPTVKTTTTPEPPFKIEVKVGPHDARSLFSSVSTAVEKHLEGQISNVVSQLLLTTHRNFNLLPNFVECAGARGRTGRRKTKVLHFDTENYPWMARIGFREPGGVLFPCAGTIISRRYILTSAHCALRKKNGTAEIMEILLEGAKIAAAGMTNQSQFKYKVEQVMAHPNYNGATRENDLALIRLAREIPAFNGTSDVKPICLPFEDGYGVWDSLPADGETAYLGGWGYGLKNMAATVEEMEDAAVTIWPNENCTYLYRGDREKIITPKQICAYGKPEKDSCRGDFGGPLMALMTRQRIFFQIGVVSYGPRCGYGVPAVYTRVSNYLSWILDTMRP